ncbi:MAG: DUF1178 family protein [Deltaproteobacteria bacterium]|nr:DUF1178 family protein [Deltaproteobacteria bacterium]
MIIYDLRCEKMHTFEGWFKDRASFEQQLDGKIITCPVCGSSELEMVPSSIAIMGKDSRVVDKRESKEISPLKALQMLHEYVEKHFDNVGDKFAKVALRIHRGEEDHRNIRGTTTQDEESILHDEGVQFLKIPVIKFES